jgi:hypothetical protein
MNPEIEQIAQKWSEDTEKALKESITKLKIGATGTLKTSIKSILLTSGDTITVKLSMQMKGRFVDGGAGRGQQMNTKKTRRKAKKFYSRTFYGRLSGLRGAISFQYAQETRRVLKEISTK